MVFAPAPSTVLLVLSSLIVIAGFVVLAVVEHADRPTAAPRRQDAPVHCAASRPASSTC